ncbi:MAG TPA: MBL fold metallo-hydrolase [Chitinophagaceae bacterium]|jgi:glyoxylase-like metal-dependent hydrolase (beta-lactamase superfamily II)|nr:MBL fold metallo-hydrolase [Chitinophagaceae bacterium]
MHRRTFIRNGALFTALLPLLPNPLSAAAASRNSGTERRRLKIGDWDAVVLRDLLFTYQSKDFFINADGQERASALARYQPGPDAIPSPFLPLLLQHGDRKVLIDTGIGFSEKPVLFRGAQHEFKGRLPALLQEEGLRNTDITDVVLTHFHPDHIGGVYNGAGQLNFPNARFHLPAAEWAFWHSAQAAQQPPMFRFFIERHVTKLKDGNLNLFTGDFTELLPGLTAVQAHGHTPGQVALIVHSGSERLLYISDAFLHPLHIERLDWQTNYDRDHAEARASRIKLLELAHRDNMLVNAFHFDFPGLGRVDKRGSGWTWQYEKA